MAEKGRPDAFRIGIELGLLGGGVSVGNHHDVDGLLQRTALPEDGGGIPVIGHFPDQDVGRVDAVLQVGRTLLVRVREEDLDVHGTLREGHLKAVLEGPLHAGGLFLHLPFLEQGGEGIGIEALPRFRIQYADLPVAPEERLREVRPPAGPFGGLQGLLEIDGLMRVVPAEDIVEAEGGVLEILVEILRGKGLEGQENGGKSQKDLFHGSEGFMTRSTAAATSS